MSEDKSYHIDVGIPTITKSYIELTTYKYHPYGLGEFRKDVVEKIEEWQSKGMSWSGHDNLTHAWRTPWDTHLRYEKLLSPIVSTVVSIIRHIDSEHDWFLRDCWISDYTQNSGANRHSHDGEQMSWSFCYYIKMPDSGPPFTICDTVQGENYAMNVAEGDLLLFRSPMEHQVMPALDRRIIISGNLVESDIVRTIYQNKHYNPNYLQNATLLNEREGREIDVDDWNKMVLDQEFNIKTQGGY